MYVCMYVCRVPTYSELQAGCMIPSCSGRGIERSRFSICCAVLCREMYTERNVVVWICGLFLGL